ncbi:sensor histidine kinase [Paenibacillus sp. 481]|uniref:sensor histidine kinase n=1 Tax=Paenibacillus sp. 481 TaxID=2835869 RepID=UPI001E4E5973|nr:HAMP domain-containing sensor histidine kinase [Paenibacillus sp. 481]UHA74878.1 HAMP domain-containing histidine kinase [Paenibacillus sp. 481]
MSIRLRLLLSYTAMMLTTVMLFVIAALLITVAFTGDVKSLKDFYNIHYSLRPLTQEDENLYLDLKYMAKNDPSQLLDEAVYKDYDFRLRKIQSGLFVRKEADVLFSSALLNQPELKHALPSYEMSNIYLRDTINIGERFYAYAKFDFVFADKERGSVYVIREMSPYAALTHNLLPVLIGVLVIVLLLANGLLYYFLTRSIIKPLNTLRQSAEKIRDGDLNFQIKVVSNDEVGQLSQAFEDMRHRLKDSVELQLQYEDNRKELITNISHDLKTPLTTIKGYIEGIRDGVADTQEKMDKYTGTIFSKVVHMDRMIDELFLYSKLDLKRLPFAFEEVELGEFLRDCVDDYTFDFVEQGIDIRLKGLQNEAPIIVIADREKMKRTLDNIVSNSAKFMVGAEKWIEIGVTAGHSTVAISVADSGLGIAPEVLPHIFERFYREDTSRNASTGGSGLGLAIAKQIVEGHGGQIWATSELGTGTVITFTLKRLTSGGAQG